jgi:HEAT repeat protein
VSDRKKKWYSPKSLADRADDQFSAILRQVESALHVIDRAPEILARRPPKPPEPPRRADALKEAISRHEADLEHLYRELSDRPAALRSAVERAHQLKARLDTERSALSRESRQKERESRLERQSQGSSSQKMIATAASDSPPDPRLRSAVSRALRGRTFGSERQQLLMEKTVPELLDSDPEVRSNAVLALAGLPSTPTQTLLGALVDDPSERVRLAAINVLLGAERVDAAGRRAFERLRHSADPHIRAACLRGLVKALEHGATPYLIQGLDDAHAEVRRTAASLLAGWTADAALRPLTLALRDTDAQVRIAAARSLGGLGDERAVFSLIRALRDPATEVAETAHRALEAVLDETIEFDPISPSREARAAALEARWKEERVARALEPEAERAKPPVELEAPVSSAPPRRPEPIQIAPEPVTAWPKAADSVIGRETKMDVPKVRVEAAPPAVDLVDALGEGEEAEEEPGLFEDEEGEKAVAEDAAGLDALDGIEAESSEDDAMADLDLAPPKKEPAKPAAETAKPAPPPKPEPAAKAAPVAKAEPVAKPEPAKPAPVPKPEPAKPVSPPKPEPPKAPEPKPAPAKPKPADPLADLGLDDLGIGEEDDKSAEGKEEEEEEDGLGDLFDPSDVK